VGRGVTLEMRRAENAVPSTRERQDRAEAAARKAQQVAERDATFKAQQQAEAESVEAKTEKLRALRRAKEGREPDQ
jgi:hypothetical protein